jgi:CII-binding regulator of phage lambda lysogenization HflD
MKTKDIKPTKDGSQNGAKKMSEVINMKDFFDHDKRIALVENAIIQMDKRFDQVERRFDQIDNRFEEVERKFDKVDKKFDKLETKMDSQFKWIIACFGMLSLTTITTLITVVMTVAKHA